MAGRISRGVLSRAAEGIWERQQGGGWERKTARRLGGPPTRRPADSEARRLGGPPTRTRRGGAAAERSAARARSSLPPLRQPAPRTPSFPARFLRPIPPPDFPARFSRPI